MENICDVLQRRRRGTERQLALLGAGHIQTRKPLGKLPERAGELWTSEEESYLAKQYALARPMNKIAHDLRRTCNSIRCRLELLKLYDDEFDEIDD